MKRILSRLQVAMAHQLSQISSTAGFTMIELLVVISVIGVLAVAVLSSINPIEQINKGRDTRTRSDAAQLINAVDRYYAIHEVYPWNVDNGASYTTTTLNDPAAAFEDDGTGTPVMGWTQILEDTAEVKQGFINRVTTDNEIRIFKALGANETMYACFEPSSQAFQQEAANNCNNGTTPPNGSANVDPCPTDTASVITDNATNPEFICLP